MLGRDEQQGIGARKFGFEARDFHRHRLLQILIVHGQVVDLDEPGVEGISAEFRKRLSQLAVDGFAAVAADNDAKLEFCHRSLYLWLRVYTKAR
jgi:hypothetical protein